MFTILLFLDLCLISYSLRAFFFFWIAAPHGARHRGLRQRRSSFSRLFYRPSRSITVTTKCHPTRSPFSITNSEECSAIVYLRQRQDRFVYGVQTNSFKLWFFFFYHVSNFKIKRIKKNVFSFLNFSFLMYNISFFFYIQFDV